ncbi:IclR family transcriptional regulator [Streptomyces caatingaensis]|uniref:IclR family transcriptional regulator n=1 Tax=Streptomyces caatingaensis TaxID=1678637 RepID=A0A0K9X9S4_9ACTN|nr:IclR family transcriptional regulator C-terminal domain-containing protein [Streptomyces caatingaensis]KNB49407.1 IclR family transcriptional regulator [Streptomyces caatingaensis]
MALKPEPITPFHSVQQALRVLEAVTRHVGGVSEAQLARETALPAGRLTPLLSMLHREHYVTRVGDGAYAAGPALDTLATGPGRETALTHRLQDSLSRLRDTIGAAVYLSSYVDGEVRITQYADGPCTPRVHEWVDFRTAAHASAVGKCLLTQLAHDDRRDHLARHRAARFTSRTITDERTLLTRLAAQPATVPVLDLQEYAVGTVCAAVPITAGKRVGSLALSLPLAHAHRLRRAAEELNRHAAPMLLSLALH